MGVVVDSAVFAIIEFPCTNVSLWLLYSIPKVPVVILLHTTLGGTFVLLVAISRCLLI